MNYPITGTGIFVILSSFILMILIAKSWKPWAVNTDMLSSFLYIKELRKMNIFKCCLIYMPSDLVLCYTFLNFHDFDYDCQTLKSLFNIFISFLCKYVVVKYKDIWMLFDVHIMSWTFKQNKLQLMINELDKKRTNRITYMWLNIYDLTK